MVSTPAFQAGGTSSNLAIRSKYMVGATKPNDGTYRLTVRDKGAVVNGVK